MGNRVHKHGGLEPWRHAQWEAFFRAWLDVYGPEPKAVSQLVDGMFPNDGVETGAEVLRMSLPEELVDLFETGGEKRRRVSFSRRIGKL